MTPAAVILAVALTVLVGTFAGVMLRVARMADLRVRHISRPVIIGLLALAVPLALPSAVSLLVASGALD